MRMARDIVLGLQYIGTHAFREFYDNCELYENLQKVTFDVASIKQIRRMFQGVSVKLR